MNPQTYYRQPNIKVRQYATIDTSQMSVQQTSKGPHNILDIYKQYQSARQTTIPKENIPLNTSTITQKISKQSTSNRDEILTKVKKLNQIRQKSHQSVIPPFKKKVNSQTSEEMSLHHRYRSTTQQKSARDAISFQQLMQKSNANETNQGRYNQNSQIIHEESSPFENKSFIEYDSKPTSQSRVKLSDAMFRNIDKDQKLSRPGEFLEKISKITSQATVCKPPEIGQYLYQGKSPVNHEIPIDAISKSIESMCRLSGKQMNLLHEVRNEVAPHVKRYAPETALQDLTCDEEIKEDYDDPEPMDNERQILEVQTPDVPGNYTKETLEYFILREKEYLPDPHYLSRKQHQLSWVMRAILVDWMMEVCSEFHLKRETFHLAVAFLDRHLSRSDTVPKLKLQLVGLTSMVIATKIEELLPRKVDDFAKAADYGYNIQEILMMEIQMIQTAKWELNPPSLNVWTNWYVCQWDIFAKQEKYHELKQFKNATEDSYQLFCQLIQLIDCSVLEIQSLQYPPRTLIASFMYLTLSNVHGIFNHQQIKNLKNYSLFLLDQQNVFNRVFGQFVMLSFGFNLIDLLPAIQYASTFFDLQISYQSPPGVQSLIGTPLEGHYEEFLSFQLHSRDMLTFVRERCRDII